jgi:rare lipoprotein A
MTAKTHATFDLTGNFTAGWRRRLARFAPLAALVAAVSLGGCAKSPMQTAGGHGKEYFPEGAYGKASPRVVADGEDVPKGGGQYLVGQPYTIAGKTYVPSEKKYATTGLASWYGDAFHGRRTANGEVYDKNSITAAHPTMPLPSYARVTNLRNNHSIIVRVNDRGPYHGGRVMDLSARAAEALDYKRVGTAKIKVEYVGRASLAGSDDRKLMATLRIDGRPAQLDGNSFSPTRIAEQAPPPRAAQVEDREAERAAYAPPETADASTLTAAQAAQLLRPSVAENGVPAATNLPPSRPQRVALVEDLGPPAPMPRNPPLPPQRPFDLGTIPGAGVPISVARR